MRSNVNRPDLSNCNVRRKLTTIYAKRRRQRTPKPYWNFLAHGRHLGYLKQNATRTWWVARYRTKGGLGLGFYHERRLRRADDKHKANGRDILSYEAATLAWSWFLSEAKSAGDVRPLGAFEPSYCPVGSVYTIAHAVNDWLAWTRIASSQRTVFNNISRINTHILPRLGTLAIEGFNSEHFGEFVLDVIETSVARGYRKPTPRVPMEQLDSETLRKRRRPRTN